MLAYDFSNSDGTIYKELYQRIRQDILNGVLRSGEKLPSKRTLVQNLGVSTSEKRILIFILSVR